MPSGAVHRSYRLVTTAAYVCELQVDTVMFNQCLENRIISKNVYLVSTSEALINMETLQNSSFFRSHTTETLLPKNHVFLYIFYITHLVFLQSYVINNLHLA